MKVFQLKNLTKHFIEYFNENFVKFIRIFTMFFGVPLHSTLLKESRLKTHLLHKSFSP